MLLHGYSIQPIKSELGHGNTHRHDMPLVAVCMRLDGRQQNAQRHLMAVRSVQGVDAILGPASLPIVAAQHCNIIQA